MRRLPVGRCAPALNVKPGTAKRFNFVWGGFGRFDFSTRIKEDVCRRSPSGQASSGMGMFVGNYLGIPPARFAGGMPGEKKGKVYALGGITVAVPWITT